MLWKWVLKTFQIFNTDNFHESFVNATLKVYVSKCRVCLRLTCCFSLFVCVVGGGSPSKEHNKKRTAVNKEVLDVEILAFSPERRWVAVVMDEALESDWRAWWGQHSFYLWRCTSVNPSLCRIQGFDLTLPAPMWPYDVCLSLIKRKTSDTT